MTETYLMQAFNLYDSIPIKAVKSRLYGAVIDSSPAELQLHYGDGSYMFIYRFGSLVFFNMNPEVIERETAAIKIALGAGLDKPTTETFQVQVGAAADNVEFEYVELKTLSLQNIRLVAVTLGQSAALEYFETSADTMLRDTSNFMNKLSKVGSVPLNSKVLLKVIGSAAGIRQHIISNLAILDPPEETWKSAEMEALFKAVQQNFDIDVRFRTLDRKLTLVQDNIEILADLASSRRAMILEFLIVILIVLELVLALIH